jgi:hypothetical protein
LRAQQPLFGAYAGDERRDKKRCKQHADDGPEGESPPQRVDQQPEIARVADDAINTARDQPMPRLDGDQPAEPVAEHKHRPESQHTTGGEENDAEPANGVPVDGPELLAVGVGRQIGGQHPDHAQRGDDPAVGPILALAGTEIAAAEECNAGQHEEGARKGNQRGVGEKPGKPAPAEDRQSEIGEGRGDRENGQLEGGRHPFVPPGRATVARAVSYRPGIGRVPAPS